MTILLISIMLINCILAISMKNTISMWYLMEIESLIFIFFLLKNKNPNKSPIIYFIVSFISSTLILMSLSTQNMELNQFNFIMEFMKNQSNLMSLAFLIKMGMTPFHLWIFKMTNNMEWMSIAMLLTIQKIIPIWALMMISKQQFLMLILLISFPIILWLPLNSKNSFFLLSASSVMNNLWIILIIMNSSTNSISFTFMYFLTTMNLILMMKKNNSKIIGNTNPKLMLISILSIMGFPPLPMFFMKLMAIKNLMLTQTNLLYMALVMISMNMLSSIMYMKFMMNSTLKLKNSNNKKKIPLNKKMNFISILISQISISIFISPT